MTWQTWTLSILVVAFAGLQYTLAWSALRDLLHRPRVRGDSHAFWALVVLCLPIFGALVYGAIGPTSFRSETGQYSTDRVSRQVPEFTPANVTPFRPATGALSERLPQQRPGITRSRAHNSAGAVARFRRPGA